MTTRQEAVRMCLEYADAYEDYPFDDPNWTVMRHRSNRRSFAFIFEHDGCMWINAKTEPLRGDFLKAVFDAVVPAYHMNKTHWIGIRLDGSMDDEAIRSILYASFMLTGSGKAR